MSMLTQALKHQPSVTVRQDHCLSLYRVMKRSLMGIPFMGFRDTILINDGVGHSQRYLMRFLLPDERFLWRHSKRDQAELKKCNNSFIQAKQHRDEFFRPKNQGQRRCTTK